MLLLVFLISVVLQVSVTLKYSEILHEGNYKVAKGKLAELPDTPENPEKNSCDCFEEDYENELTKIEGDTYSHFFCCVFNTSTELQLLNKRNWNSILLKINNWIYLSVCNIRI